MIRLIPYIFIPIVIAPLMDRLPRKTFLVVGDVVNGIIYTAMGLWLIFFDFSYIGYLVISIFLACLGSVVEFVGRSIGSALQYRVKIAKEKKFGIVFFVYMLYETMDMRYYMWLYCYAGLYFPNLDEKKSS